MNQEMYEILQLLKYVEEQTMLICSAPKTLKRLGL